METMIEALGNFRQVPRWNEVAMALLGTALLLLSAVMRRGT
jgi:hypothetical protein